MSSKRQGLASKLLTVLGGAGLAISICAPRASAQATVPPPWTNANYANRYICNVTSGGGAFTGIMKVNPNGAGAFTAGTLNAAADFFSGFDPTALAPNNFCSYSLDTSSSGYAVDSHGNGADTLTWDASSSNNPACPATFTMTTRFELRNNVNGNNVVPRTMMTSDNFLNQSNSGYGYCLK